MSCPPTLDVPEKILAKALAKTRGSCIKGSIFEFLGHGTAVALTEAAYLFLTRGKKF